MFNENMMRINTIKRHKSSLFDRKPAGIYHHAMISTEIKYLLTIKETKNITKAAEVLRIAQPSLSRYLKDKEKEIGHELFLRENSRITGLTEYGEMYFSYAEKINELEEEYLRRKERFEQESNVVQLLIPMVITQALVQFIVRIRRMNPEINFRIATDSMRAIKEKIRTEQDVFDYAIVHSSSEKKDMTCVYQANTTLVIPESIQQKYKDQIYVDAQGNKHIDLHVLQKETFYISGSSTLIGQVARTIFAEYDFTPEKVVEWDSTDLSMMMADKEGAICFYTYNPDFRHVHVFLDREYANYFYLQKVNPNALDFKA